jgi:predicted membrane protein
VAQPAETGYVVGMRLAMRVLFVLAVPGIVFGFLTRVPPLVFDMDWGFSSYESGWIEVLGAVIIAATVAAVVAAAVFVMVTLGIGAARR